ncbi:MAG: RidA family protein [Verrucomicrobia bacterium]|nr:RidA family protein [Verrucomicrobiota bacterium]MCH8525831.1 RidA family protein [Kiritimatiellia bacterium]
MEIIQSNAAPAAVGPYSQAVQVGHLLFCSGQIPVDPETKAIVEGDIHVQVEQVLKNISAVLSAANLTLNNVVKATVFMVDLKDFPVMNGLYAQAFGDHKPARSTIQVAALPLGARVEIEVIAEL